MVPCDTSPQLSTLSNFANWAFSSSQSRVCLPWGHLSCRRPTDASVVTRYWVGVNHEAKAATEGEGEATLITCVDSLLNTNGCKTTFKFSLPYIACSRKFPHPSTCNHQTETPLLRRAFNAFCKASHTAGLRWNHVMLWCCGILHKYFNKIKADCNRNSGCHWQAPATHHKEIKRKIRAYLKSLGRYASGREATIRAIAKSQAAGWKD